MHADYLLAASAMADAQRRAELRSLLRHTRRRRHRYRLARLARWLAATASDTSRCA